MSTPCSLLLDASPFTLKPFGLEASLFLGTRRGCQGGIPMVSLPEDATFRESELPGFIEHLPAALKVLRRSVEDLLEYFWDERYRNRACEQAYALSNASKVQGLVRIFALSR